MGYSTAANLKTEIIAQMLLSTLGYEKTAKLLPRNINPDDPGDTGEARMPDKKHLAFSLPGIRDLLAYTHDRKLRAGSNNWAIAPAKSQTRAAVLSGDPHLDPRMLPGVWYPLGLICPGIRAVGCQIPGIPGMGVGRTAHVALSATNNYGDMMDLYVETIDPDNPDHYMEGDRSYPFIQIRETLKIKDKTAPSGFREEPVLIRATRRGPVVSTVLKGLDKDKTISFRFAPAESMTPDVGLFEVLTVKDARELASAMQRFPMGCFNWVFADTSGNIGHQVSGRIPVRANGDGTFPFKVTDGTDNWQGWIPPDQMPGAINPSKNWIGTCNHKTVDTQFPYYYSSFFAPSYRYSRLKDLMSGRDKMGLKDMWVFQRDTKNPMAQALAPVMAKILMTRESTRDLGRMLSDWDFMDDPDKTAPTVFLTLYRFFALSVFEDDLGDDNAMMMLNAWYFWQERLQQAVLDNDFLFFDDIRTRDRVETLEDMVFRAAEKARAYLVDTLGKDSDQWTWGTVHYLELVNPIVRKGALKTIMGTGPMPMGGSGETLYRGGYEFDTPYAVSFCASLRIVADMGDGEKLMAVLPGGVAARTFHPHQKDLVDPFMDGSIQYFWFSDPAIEAHAKSGLDLLP